MRAYFGNDASAYETRSPVTHVAASALPVMIAIAEFDNPLLDLYGLELAHRIAITRRRAPRFMRLAGHNHILPRLAGAKRTSHPRSLMSALRGEATFVEELPVWADDPKRLLA